MNALAGLSTLLGDLTTDPLLEWARRVGREVARDYGHKPGSQEADDLEQTAVAHLVEIAPRFDAKKHPGCADLPGAFRGYAYRSVHTACVRFADNLRGGGTTKGSVRPANRRTVGTLEDASAVADEKPTRLEPDPVTRVRVNTVLYAVPFERLLRPLSTTELEDLEASIETHGILDPVTVCTLERYGPSIVDGGHRSGIASRKGIPVPVSDYGLISYELAELLARTLNVHRRHLTAEELRAHKAAQAERMLRMRADGLSLRAIARLEGIKQAIQVDRAIRKAGGVTTVTPVTAAREAVKACKSLDAVFQSLTRLLAMDREQVIRLAEECDIPFSATTPGRENWPALGMLTTLRGMLERVA